MMDGMMAGMWLWAFLALIALVAVIVLATLGSVWLSRSLKQGVTRSPASSADNAREVLRRRYAAGEIDDEEFERRLSALDWR